VKAVVETGSHIYVNRLPSRSYQTSLKLCYNEPQVLISETNLTHASSYHLLSQFLLSPLEVQGSRPARINNVVAACHPGVI